MIRRTKQFIVLVCSLGLSEAIPAQEKAWWKDTYYRVPTHEFDKNQRLIIRKPEDLPQHVPGKKRITLMGDSLMTDDEDTGWAHHLAYKIGHDKMPFDVVNVARSGATIAPPAHIHAMKDGEGENCYGKQTPGKEFYLLHWHYQDTVHGKNRWELAEASKPDYVLLQIGANDLTPMCMMDPCIDEKSPQYDKTLKGLNRSSCFYEGSPDEDGQFLKIQEGLTKMVKDIQAFQSKPQILLITPPPYLDCCARKEWIANGMSDLVSHWWAKLPQVYRNVANDTGVKLLDLHELYKAQPQKALCESQKLAIEQHEGLDKNFCDAIHWGRPEIVAAVNNMLLEPEAAFIAQEQQVKALTQSLINDANAKIVSSGVLGQSSAPKSK